MGAGASAPVFKWASCFSALFALCSLYCFGPDMRVFFCLLGLLLAGSALADTWVVSVPSGVSGSSSSADGACALYYAFAGLPSSSDDATYHVTTTASGTVATGSADVFYCQTTVTTVRDSDGVTVSTVSHTPASVTRTSSGGSCPSAGGAGPDFGWAAGYTPYPPGASTSISEVQGFSLPPASVCISGCAYSRGAPYAVYGDQVADASGHYSITVNFHSSSTAASCSGGDTPGTGAPGSGTAAAQTGPSDGSGCSGNQITCAPGPGNTCPKGSAPEVVGGAVTCVNYNLAGSGGSQTSSQNTSAASAPAGSSASAPGTYQNSTSSGSGDSRTTTTTTTIVGADGSTNTTTTACTGSDCGNCTYTGPGSCGTTPNTFTGDCSSGFAAGGDPVQDATATAANLINCALKPDTTDPTYTLGKAMMSGTDSGASSPSSTVDFSSGMTFDQSDPFSESGLQDFSVSLAGQTLVVPMSNANGVLNALGLLFVAGTLMWAAWFVIEGV